jgi:hypothetical protein
LSEARLVALASDLLDGFSIVAAHSGSQQWKTQTPRFFPSRAVRRSGRSLIRSSRLPGSDSSPGPSYSFSRTGFESTIRPTLSIVSLAVTADSWGIGIEKLAGKALDG